MGCKGSIPPLSLATQKLHPAGLEYLCHVLQGEFILKMTTSRLYFRVGNCILNFQTTQMAKELHLRSGDKLQNFRVCLKFFHKFSRCYKIWRSLTSAHSENSHYSNSLSPLPKHLKQTRFILEWEFGKQSALHSQVKLQKDHLPTFFFFLLNCTLRQNFKRKRIIVHWLQKNYTLSCIIYIYLDWIAR